MCAASSQSLFFDKRVQRLMYDVVFVNIRQSHKNDIPRKQQIKTPFLKTKYTCYKTSLLRNVLVESLVTV